MAESASCTKLGTCLSASVAASDDRSSDAAARGASLSPDASIACFWDDDKFSSLLLVPRQDDGWLSHVE